MALNFRPGRTGPFRQWGDGSAGAATGGLPGSTLPQAGSGGLTGWVNVQDYLRANQAQAEAIGLGLANQLEKQASGAAQQAEAYRTAANTYAQTGAPTDPGPNPYFGVPNAPKGPGRVEGITAWNKANDRFNNYTAPTSPTMPSAPGRVLEQIQTAATPAGRATYFADRAGPTYNQGQANLDSYLAGAGAGGQALQALAGKYQNILDLVNYPYPGYPSAGNRPPGVEGDTRPAGGTIPTPVATQSSTPGLPMKPAQPRKKRII